MNSSSKVPPRFVPTLTDVVEVVTDSTATQVTESADSEVQEQRDTTSVASSSEPVRSDEIDGNTAGKAAFHSPWLADGLYAKRGVVAIRQDLPPLPESLPPQQSFATDAVAVDEAAADFEDENSAQLTERDVKGPSLDEALSQLSEQHLHMHAHAAEALSEAELVEEIEPEAISFPEVDEPVSDAVSAPEQAISAPLAGDMAWNAQAPQVTEEYLVHRLMQRVDLVLDQRLREAISAVVQEQTRSIVLRLREEVESVVRHSVYEAVEDELAQAQEKARASAHEDKPASK